MTVGEYIKTYRINRGWTQEELAEKSKLNRNSICRYETGEAMPRMPQIQRIAAAFGVSYDVLTASTPQSAIIITREQAEALRVAAEIAYGFYKTIFSMSPEKETPSSAEYKQYIAIADAGVSLLEALRPED